MISHCIMIIRAPNYDLTIRRRHTYYAPYKTSFLADARPPRDFFYHYYYHAVKFTSTPFIDIIIRPIKYSFRRYLKMLRFRAASATRHITLLLALAQAMRDATTPSIPDDDAVAHMPTLPRTGISDTLRHDIAALFRRQATPLTLDTRAGALLDASFSPRVSAGGDIASLIGAPFTPVTTPHFHAPCIHIIITIIDYSSCLRSTPPAPGHAAMPPPHDDADNSEPPLR